MTNTYVVIHNSGTVYGPYTDVQEAKDVAEAIQQNRGGSGSVHALVPVRRMAAPPKKTALFSDVTPQMQRR
jgi:hypothetical protein